MRIQQSLKRKKVYIPIIIVLLVFGIWFVQYVRVEVSAYKDWQLLESVDVQMSKDFNKVLAKIDEKPSSVKHDKNCTYPNADGDPGPPSCGIEHEVSFTSNDEFSKLDENLRSRFMLGEPSSSITEPERTNYWVFYRYDVQCTLQLDHDKSIRLNFWCGKAAQKEIYKVYDYNL